MNLTVNCRLTVVPNFIASWQREVYVCVQSTCPLCKATRFCLKPISFSASFYSLFCLFHTLLYHYVHWLLLLCSGLTTDFLYNKTNIHYTIDLASTSSLKTEPARWTSRPKEHFVKHQKWIEKGNNAALLNLLTYLTSYLYCKLQNWISDDMQRW